MDSAERRRGTVSQYEQWMVQDNVFHMYNLFAELPRSAQTLMLELQRDSHVEYLTDGLRQLGPSFVVLDANRPWLCYWILHSIALLGEAVDLELEVNAVDFLNRCQDSNGGFGGGPGQMPHLATTYAAVNALITLGGHRAFSLINRITLYEFLRQMKDTSGGFRMHENGEIDVRACYTAISVASILNILDDELVRDVGNYIVSCQTYEGGIAGEPGSEAHGGYTFCGLATMIIINEVNRLNLPRLIDWAVFRQGVECGFQGRTNKLVDGCYSFWQGGMLALVQGLDLVNGEHRKFYDAKGGYGSDSDSGEESTDGSAPEGDETSFSEKGGPQSLGSLDDEITGHSDTGVQIDPLFHAKALQQYLLICSQVQDGGFRDKPGKPRDYYHTCYCLSGLSLCQYISSKDEYSPPLPRAVLGPYSNLLEPVHPLYNVVSKQYHEAREFFTKS